MKSYRDELGHYFRFIYNIFKFIDESIVSNEDKIKYSKIIRAQLSDYELTIIFYNCLTWRGCESFKALIEKYSIFDNIPFDLLIEHEHMRHYEMSAFDGNTSYFVGR
nr:putative phage abortive infection protein [Serratia ureilytica]